MVGKLGEKNFPGLVDQLFQILNSDTSTVDQSGAAQGLSEIFAALVTIRLDSVFTDITTELVDSKCIDKGLT